MSKYCCEVLYMTDCSFDFCGNETYIAYSNAIHRFLLPFRYSDMGTYGNEHADWEWSNQERNFSEFSLLFKQNNVAPCYTYWFTQYLIYDHVEHDTEQFMHPPVHATENKKTKWFQNKKQLRQTQESEWRYRSDQDRINNCRKIKQTICALFDNQSSKNINEWYLNNLRNKPSVVVDLRSELFCSVMYLCQPYNDMCRTIEGKKAALKSMEQECEQLCKSMKPSLAQSMEGYNLQLQMAEKISQKEEELLDLIAEVKQVETRIQALVDQITEIDQRTDQQDRLNLVVPNKLWDETETNWY